MQRLFGHYHRIVSVFDPFDAGPNHGDKTFLDADMEEIIIRLRILLNDLAFIVRQLYPKDARGVPGTTGNKAQRNREMSIKTLLDFHGSKPTFAPRIGQALLRNKAWMLDLRGQRDNIVHYKSKVVIFGEGPSYEFGMLNAAGAEQWIEMPDGTRRVATRNVFDFVHCQTRSLLEFMHVDLAEAIKQHADDTGMTFRQLGGGARMQCVGIELFQQVNERFGRISPPAQESEAIRAPAQTSQAPEGELELAR